MYEKALLWQRNESMANFFFWPQILVPLMIFQLLPVSFTSEDKYAMTEGWRSEELIISYVKTLRFTVGIILSIKV